MNNICVRPLRSSEWPTFKDVRLVALQSAPGMFATSYQEALSRSSEDWRRNIAGPDHQVFGLFDGPRLIGIAGVFGGQEEANRDTAFLVMSFIMPEYRGRGLSAMLYRARLDWIQQKGKFKRVVAAIRASNEVSQRACRHFGLECKGHAARNWPDGATEDELIYELRF